MTLGSIGTGSTQRLCALEMISSIIVLSKLLEKEGKKKHNLVLYFLFFFWPYFSGAY